ncbi:MAG TPA: threonine synthase [Woeseiaceae bacterium]|nr:threonine synthase [Woeseiaceae bacterium]
MKFTSTRSGKAISLDDALVSGIAPDGGLFVPVPLPRFDIADFENASSIVDVASVLLAPFFENSILEPEFEAIIGETFSFPMPLTELPVAAGRAHLLELFHGPTAAFKDVGARFLAACLTRLQKSERDPLTILVATSGDTGGAVAAAFNERPGIRVVVLFPDRRVSDRQARQLSCWGDNVLTLAVEGTFDDCQALVKQAMADPALKGRYRFGSANSINIGRLLPQCSWYAYASLARYRQTGLKPSFIVPTGNLGNGLALLLTRRMGLPVGDAILSTNANRVIADFLGSGEWQPRASIPTLATAMDVGNPSNMERLRAIFDDTALHRIMRVCSVTDEQIEGEIRQNHAEFGFAICPHTATAAYAYRQLDDTERRMKDWIIVATAHPAKFEQTVEPLIGQTLPVPDSLREILQRPGRSVSIAPDLREFAEALRGAFRLDGDAVAGDK